MPATLLLLVVLAAWNNRAAGQVEPTAVEMGLAQTWVEANLLSPTRLPPFSFQYGAEFSTTLLRTWDRQLASTRLDDSRSRHEIVWTDPQNRIQVRCVAIQYHDYPAVEWTVYFKNIASQNTSICRDILALDMSLSRTERFEYVLHGILGDFNAAESFQPYQLTLSPSTSKVFAPPAISGKSSDGPDGWPYFNLQMPGGGIVMAVGWPGQWQCSFTRVGARGLTIKAGQQLTRMFLMPGEEIRTPMMTLLFWRGTDVTRSQNLWRRWYVDHVLPVTDGVVQQPVQQIQVSGYHNSTLYYFLSNGIVPDICWRDAGWYPIDQGPYTGSLAWLNTGTWEIDPSRYPRGFRSFSDYARSSGSSFLLWFEPERVGSPNSFLGNRPEWLLAGTSTTVGDILNLGNPAALNWVINHFDSLIVSEGIDWYREDMNGNGPLPAWRNNDSSTRQGITENFYVQGHLKLWDELRARHPGLRIDSCASGGRRNDLETMRRAVPLLRSDFQFVGMNNVVNGNQCHTYGLSSWLPFHGTASYLYDPYSFRSFYGACFGMGALSPTNVAAQQQAYRENELVAPFMVFGDYYPLTPYSLASNAWIGWQFHRPEEKAGCIQVFRRENANQGSITLYPEGLDPDEIYEIENLDETGLQSATGTQLMTNGLTVTLPANGSAILLYRATQDQQLRAWQRSQ